MDASDRPAVLIAAWTNVAVMMHLDRASVRRQARLGVTSIPGFACFLALLLARIVMHRPWRDEAQHWLIVAAAKSPLDLLVLPGEGHPPLWYLVCYPFALIDPRLWVLKALGGCCAVGSLALLWFGSRLRLWEKLLLSGSFCLSFQYAVLARGYALATLLLILFAVGFRHWRRRPFVAGCLLGAAALIHIYVVAVAAALCALTLLQWWRTTWSIRAAGWFALPFVVLAGASVASVLASALPVLDSGAITGHAPSRWTVGIAARMVGSAFVPDGLGLQPIDLLQHGAAVTLILAAIRRPLPGLIFMACVAVITLAELFIYGSGGNPSHAATIFLLFACWYLVGHGLLLRPAAVLLLIASVVGGAAALTRDLALPYSSAEAAAGLIRMRGLQDANWVAFPDYTGTVTFAVLGRPATSLECRCAFTYVPWTRREPVRSAGDLQNRLTRTIENDGAAGTYLLLSTPQLGMLAVDLTARFCAREIGHTGPAVMEDETFTLFRMSRRGTVDCAP